VSGAATARALYWEDGYATYYPQTGSAFVRSMNDLEAYATQWLKGADYTGLSPGVTDAPDSSPYIVYYVAGENQVRGYARSKAQVAPDWSAPSLPSVSLSLALPSAASDGEWAVQFSTTKLTTLPEGAARSTANVLEFSVPAGFSSLAFVATRRP